MINKMLEYLIRVTGMNLLVEALVTGKWKTGMYLLGQFTCFLISLSLAIVSTEIIAMPFDKWLMQVNDTFSSSLIIGLFVLVAITFIFASYLLTYIYNRFAMKRCMA
ncbi:TPA: hypothetical protein PNT14_002722 [Staphylococcus aureus]|nr:hypothetical protein [Staphylococcus aureus]